MLIFAYGSNLDGPDFAQWCDRAGIAGARLDPVAAALLLDHRLACQWHSKSRRGGAFTLAERPGSTTPGLLFEANEAAIEALDRREGVQVPAYERLDMHAVLEDGRAVPALTWNVPPARREAHFPLQPDYLATCREGARAHGLPDGPMVAAAEGHEDNLAPFLFVYGTLLAGEPNAQHLGGLPRTAASVPGALHDCGPYPAMALGAARALGEVVEVEEGRMCALDQLEGARPAGAPGGHYRRTVLPATLADGRIVRAQTYVVDDASAFPTIESGDWRSIGNRYGKWLRHTEQPPAPC